MSASLLDWSAFDGPATYRIVVQGTLALDLADRLEGMSIGRELSDDGAVLSVLAGELADQSALTSVLLSLHELRVTLISIERLPVPLPDQPVPEKSETTRQDDASQ